MTAPNVDLLKRTLAHIEANRGLWFQRDWRRKTQCGTAYCFAGWAVTLHGAKWWKDPNGKIALDLITPPGEADDVSVEINSYAAKILGLDPWLDDGTGEHLFHEDNSLDDLRRIVGKLCEEAS